MKTKFSIDNWDQIKAHLKFDGPDQYYFLQVLQRKKDHPEGTVVGCNNNSRLIKPYYIYSVEQYDKYRKEISMLCQLFEARACISLNRLDVKDTCLAMMERLASNIRSGHYQQASKLFSTVSGATKGDGEKRWILDVDHKNRRAINDMISLVDKLRPEGVKFVDLIESKSGFHIITSPFDVQEFKKHFPDIEIHKNNPTNILIP